MNTVTTLGSGKANSTPIEKIMHTRRNAGKESLPFHDEEPRPPVKHEAITAALSTPHDAILTELRCSQHNDHPTPHLSTQPDPLQQSTPRLSMRPSQGSVDRDGSQSGEALSNGRRSAVGPAAETIPFEKDTFYDPFTGALAGLMRPHPTDQPSEGKKSDTEFNQAKDELWCHLGKIRELQSHIAGMHVQMEGLGLNDGLRGGPKRPGAVPPRMGSDSIGVDDWTVGGEEETDLKAENTTEFSHLSESFEGRKVAIDGIMDKLDELSRALTTFHALPTPVVDFSGSTSGHNAGGSYSMRPGLQSPSPPPFSNPNSPTMSPPLSPVPIHVKKPPQLKMSSLGRSQFTTNLLNDSPIQEYTPERKTTQSPNT